MAVDRIRIGTSTTMAGELRNFIRYLRLARDAGEYVKGVMEENVDGADYSDLETEFGLSAGQGTTVYNLVGSAKEVIDGAAVQQLVARVG